LAALRVGALIAHPDALAPLRRLLPPYSLNICALRAVEAAMGDRAYLNGYVAQSEASRRLIYEFCDARGIPYWRSEANFVLLRLGPEATAITAALAASGIYIRDKSAAPGCEGCVRITAGVLEHTRACLNALEDVLASRTR
jgi:histidinol-phosphate aminotransferase